MSLGYGGFAPDNVVDETELKRHRRLADRLDGHCWHATPLAVLEKVWAVLECSVRDDGAEGYQEHERDC